MIYVQRTVRPEAALPRRRISDLIIQTNSQHRYGGENMLKIRLRRMGAKKAPFYRIVVAESRFARDGRFVEEIGTYNPLKDPVEVKIDLEKAEEWIKKGAQPTDKVKAIIEKAKA
jgi:small subunit ribosomal protein S16